MSQTGLSLDERFTKSMNGFARVMQHLAYGDHCRKNRRQTLNTFASTKKMFNRKLQKVLRYAEKEVMCPAALRFNDESEHDPQHRERAVVAEAYRSTHDKHPVITPKAWKGMTVGYGTINGFALALIKLRGQEFIGVAKCHSKDSENWEFGCMLALYRASLLIFKVKGGRKWRVSGSKTCTAKESTYT